MGTTKTIPVSAEIHRLIRHVAINYDVKIQEAAARIILAGLQALELEVPPPKISEKDPFWKYTEKELIAQEKSEKLAAEKLALKKIKASTAKAKGKIKPTTDM
jgi:hypothetical protein